MGWADWGSTVSSKQYYQVLVKLIVRLVSLVFYVQLQVNFEANVIIMMLNLAEDVK